MYNSNKSKIICSNSHLCAFSNKFSYSNVASNQFLPISYVTNQLNSQIRQISYSSLLLSDKSCSKIEEAVNTAKLNCQNKNSDDCDTKNPKKSIKQKIIDELNHYYYGFKLLGLNTKISSKLAIKKMRGIEELTRREHNLVSFL
jgi:LETM1 and EF-hand domain-containing protein 1, mitochondrial